MHASVRPPLTPLRKGAVADARLGGSGAGRSGVVCNDFYAFLECFFEVVDSPGGKVLGKCVFYRAGRSAAAIAGTGRQGGKENLGHNHRDVPRIRLVHACPGPEVDVTSTCRASGMAGLHSSEYSLSCDWHSSWPISSLGPCMHL